MTTIRQHHSLKFGSFFCVLLACVLTASVCTHTSAQISNQTTLSLFVGGSEYDLSGVGWTAVFGPRIDHIFHGPFAVQLSVPVYSYEPQFGDRITFLLPELSLLLSPRIGRVSPYLGLGPGWSFVVAGPSYGDALTLHAALGVRVGLSSSWDVVTELRGRAIDPWAGSTADISGGIGYRF